MGTEAGTPNEPKMIPHLTLEQMTREIRDYIATRTAFNLFWTDDWSPAFYRAQARLGFIAVAAPRPDGAGNLLLPELQDAYAVLNWPDLTLDRGVRRILESGRLEHEHIHLVAVGDPEVVLTRLGQAWGDRTWIRPEYARLVRLLATERERAADPGFRVVATTLLAGDEPVAGELGYAVGRAYVSLSGFLRRDRPEWNHFGKVQMVLLSRHLQAAGFAFWNLGHPQMPYKRRLGARILSRVEFLPRWDAAAAADLPSLGW